MDRPTRVRTPPPRETILNARREIMERAERGQLVWSEAVRALRHSLGMTQPQFARMLRLSTARVSEIENGQSNPTVETLARIGKPFGLTIGFVLEPIADDIE